MKRKAYPPVLHFRLTTTRASLARPLPSLLSSSQYQSRPFSLQFSSRATFSNQALIVPCTSRGYKHNHLHQSAIQTCSPTMTLFHHKRTQQNRRKMSLHIDQTLTKGKSREQDKLVVIAREGREFERTKQFEDALAKYDEAIALDSNEPLGWNLKADLLYYLADYEGALACYEQVVRCNPGSAKPFVDMALCYVRVNNPEKAISLLSDAIFLDAKLIPAFGYRADILFERGELERAFEDYSMVISLEGKNVSAWSGIGKTEMKRGKLLNARTAFLYAIQYAEGEYTATKHTAKNILKDEDDMGRMENALRQLLDAYSSLGVLEQLQNNLPAAIEAFSKGIRIFFGDAHDKPGQRDWESVGRLKSALSDLYTKRAYIHLLEYEQRLCQQDCDAALALNPDNYLVRFVRGQSCYQLGAYREAHDDLTRFLDAEKGKARGEGAKQQQEQLRRLIESCKSRM